MARNNQQFTTIRTEGALLPPDILQRIASQKVDGVRPADYHLPEGFKITEATTQSWDILKKHWKSFQEAREHLANSDTGTSLTNERWLLPLFRELDYGRLTTQPSPVIEDRVYPIERFYHKTPIHLIGCNLFLDRRTKGARGAATASPHSMVQEYLNRSNDHLWAFLSNGRQLRLLRDNVALSRQAYVEFDLEAMMEGEVYSDFALLWMLCHQSRLETEKTDECWLEKWSKLAREDGTRVLKDLRTGVGNAIEALGRGFIGHPQNDDLRRKLQESGSLSKNEFYRQLLRIVYRLLFLFVAEDRELLHPPVADDADDETREQHRKATELYRKYYSTGRLREISLKLRGSKHGDLWHSLSLVFASLGRNDGCSRLGLVGLGSFLWNNKSVADLAGPHEADGDSVPVQIANDDLLTAIRALAFVEQDKVLRSVDYRNLGSEELGSVYESLLELHPDMHVEARQFDLRTAAGNERKTTGSYYTPDSLVQCLLDSALDPVVEDRLKGKKGKDAEQAILDIKVCDPACGSGHFLIAAAHRLARHLARIRTGESEPSPGDHQHALRDVIGRCIYGVDVNPMAVELCKVSLWMEAIEPGKPLSFLEHHIRCGNSLLGTTPKLLADGIPDDAFKPIEGDIKAVVNDLKKQNKKERTDFKRGQHHLFEPYIKLGNLPAEFNRLSIAEDGTVADVTEKERRYAELVSGADYQNARLLADTWCAVFVWKKDNSELGNMCPTERDFRNIEVNPHSILPHVKSEVRRLAKQYRFFHWHLAFPDVFRLPKEGKADNEQSGWNGGFNVVLGNPPWDKVEVLEKEWFAGKDDEIANARTGSKRKKLIASLQDREPSLYSEYADATRQVAGLRTFIQHSGRYVLCNSGRINTYSTFAETNRIVVEKQGRIGCVLPSGIATDDSTKAFFQELVKTQTLERYFDFENKKLIFDRVAPVMRFCLLALCGSSAASNTQAVFVFFAHGIEDTKDPRKLFSLDAKALSLINPNTGTCPIFRTASEAVLAKHIYGRTGVLLNHTTKSNPWRVMFRQGLFNMTSDSHHFTPAADLRERGYSQRGNIYELDGHSFLPLFEAKLLQQFDHRHGTFEGLESDAIFNTKAATKSPDAHEKLDPTLQTIPRYWVDAKVVEDAIPKAWSSSWFLAFRDIIQPMTNARCAVFGVIPRVAVSNNMPLLLTEDKDPSSLAYLLANFNSFVFDFATRQKIGGTHLNFYIVEQLPTLSPEMLDSRGIGVRSLKQWLLSRVLELTYTAWDLEPFASDCGYGGPPFRWDEERRFLLRCELDAAYFHLYLGPPAEWGTDSPQLREMFPTPRHAVDYIMETFPIIKRKDKKRTEIRSETGEVVKKGTYITKKTILSIYDDMQKAIDTGQPYQARLDPPPGPPTDTDGNFIPASEWDESSWPSHIHPPRTEVKS